MNYTEVDLSNWKRRKQFEFYKDFSEPFFGVTFEVDVTKVYLECKEKGDSFFIRSTYFILKAMNDIPEFRLRMMGENVVEFNQIGCSSTIARPDGTFGFSYFDYDEDYEIFSQQTRLEIERVRNSEDFVPSADKLDTIHFSPLPWLKFTSVSHARHFTFKDSIPKMSTGKITKINNQYVFPISIHAHHALMDGYHIGQFETKFSEYIR